MNPRNIGGSILPLSCARILAPLPFGERTLQVRALPDADTHALFVTTEHGDCLLATHSNGYSCHALAERMVAGDVQRVREQAEYILLCGGTTRAIESICEYLTA